MFENVAPNGALVEDSIEGRLLNPGHAIECGWFLLDYAARTGDLVLQSQALKIIDWMFNYGWDKE